MSIALDVKNLHRLTMLGQINYIFGKGKIFQSAKELKKNSRPHIVVGKRLSKVNATILTNLFPTGLTQFKVMGQCFNVMTQ